MACRTLMGACQRNLLHIKKSTAVISSKLYSQDSWIPEDKKTHTGQIWEKDDYRLARFIDRPKQINEQFAIDLIEKTPPSAKKDRVVWCDGGGGPTGHPRVYINLDKPGNHICGYCGLRFYKNQQHH
ncbi:hypothetical protein R5R35_002582 [Gryllus longicercus]